MPTSAVINTKRIDATTLDRSRGYTPRRLATSLGNACRNVDLVARLETDLFAVLVPETMIDRCGPLVARMLADALATGAPCRVGTAGLGAPGDDVAHSAGSLLRLACARADG